MSGAGSNPNLQSVRSAESAASLRSCSREEEDGTTTWAAQAASSSRASSTCSPSAAKMTRSRSCCEGSRSEEHTSELQSLMRISYAVFCLKKKKKTRKIHLDCINDKKKT